MKHPTYTQFLRKMRRYYQHELHVYYDIMKLNRKHNHIRNQYDELVAGSRGASISTACLVSFCCASLK